VDTHVTSTPSAKAGISPLLERGLRGRCAPVHRPSRPRRWAMRSRGMCRAASGRDFLRRTAMTVNSRPKRMTTRALGKKFWICPGAGAIGEIGLDYHYSPETRAAQRKLFARMLALGAYAPLAGRLCIADEAEDDNPSLCSRNTAGGVPGGILRGCVLRCFTGGPEFVERYWAVGLLVRLCASPVSAMPIVSARRQTRARRPLADRNRFALPRACPTIAAKRNEPAFVAGWSPHAVGQPRRNEPLWNKLRNKLQ